MSKSDTFYLKGLTSSEKLHILGTYLLDLHDQLLDLSLEIVRKEAAENRDC
jgi:hypothetical protein